jgi:hypothetical protein
MPRAHINDVNLYYESHGNGVPLVLAYRQGGDTGITVCRSRQKICVGSSIYRNFRRLISIYTFTNIMTDVDKLMARLHNRIPVMLAKDLEDA